MTLDPRKLDCEGLGVDIEVASPCDRFEKGAWLLFGVVHGETNLGMRPMKVQRTGWKRFESVTSGGITTLEAFACTGLYMNQGRLDSIPDPN